MVFRVYPGEGHPAERRPPSERYVGVRVYQNVAAMRRALAAWCSALDVADGAAGVTVQAQLWATKRGQFDQRSPEHATVFLTKDHLDMQTVTHELGHAALIFARDDRLRLVRAHGGPADRDEESFCYVLGRLAEGFWENNPLVKKVDK